MASTVPLMVLNGPAGAHAPSARTCGCARIRASTAHAQARNCRARARACARPRRPAHPPPAPAPTHPPPHTRPRPRIHRPPACPRMRSAPGITPSARLPRRLRSGARMRPARALLLLRARWSACALVKCVRDGRTCARAASAHPPPTPKPATAAPVPARPRRPAHPPLAPAPAAHPPPHTRPRLRIPLAPCLRMRSAPGITPSARLPLRLRSCARMRPALAHLLMRARWSDPLCGVAGSRRHGGLASDSAAAAHPAGTATSSKLCKSYCLSPGLYRAVHNLERVRVGPGDSRNCSCRRIP